MSFTEFRKLMKLYKKGELNEYDLISSNIVIPIDAIAQAVAIEEDASSYERNERSSLIRNIFDSIMEPEDEPYDAMDPEDYW